jgi:hypothetical protein
VGNEVENLGESVQDAGGTTTPPSAAASPEPEVKQTSLKADDKLEAALTRLEDLEGMFRGWQGDKDRGTNRALEGVEKLNERFNEYEVFSKMRQDGKTEDEARREMVLEEIVRERMGTQVEQEPVGSQAVETSGFNADEFLRGQDIDPNSAEALTLIRDGKTGIMDYYNFALSEKTTPAVTPNPAQVMPVGTGGVLATPDVLELTARLQALQMEPATAANLKERKQISEELAKLTPRK